MNKRRKKSPLKGQPVGKVASLRAIRHLDPLSQQHQRDKQAFGKIREWVDKQRKSLPFDITPLTKLKYPSLRGGFCVDRSQNVLSSKEHDRLLIEINLARSYYESTVMGRHGKERNRKRKASPADQIAVTFRPDFAMAFMAMEQAKLDYLRAFFLEKALPIIFNEFEIATGLEVIAAQIHPEESELHFHVNYTKVSSENKLLWLKSGVGRRGIRTLGQSGIGTLRLVDGHFWGEECAHDARDHLQNRIEDNGGDDPIDFRLSQTLDGLCAHFFSSERFKPFLDIATTQYKEELEIKKNNSQQFLKAENDDLKIRLQQMAKELERLKQEPPKNDISLKNRLSFLPQEILADADSFTDVVHALLAKGDSLHLAYLDILAKGENIPLSNSEREIAHDNLALWRDNVPSPQNEKKTTMRIKDKNEKHIRKITFT